MRRRKTSLRHARRSTAPQQERERPATTRKPRDERTKRHSPSCNGPSTPRARARPSEPGSIAAVDIDLPHEDDPRRIDVRRWFEEHPTPTAAELVDSGFVTPHWPKPWGLDAEPELQLIIDDEMKRAGVTKPLN